MLKERECQISSLDQVTGDPGRLGSISSSMDDLHKNLLRASVTHMNKVG